MCEYELHVFLKVMTHRLKVFLYSLGGDELPVLSTWFFLSHGS